jgi:hypothetical protein
MAGERRVLRGILAALLLASAAPASAPAQEDRTRIDLFKPDGRREGYAIIDRKTGRVDFYDASSRRTGHGKVDDTGRIERFDLKGRRMPETAAPPPDRAR